jgi:DNA invertase Pin-like site-specific DNA recombinase
MLTVLGGLAEFERELIRARRGRGARPRRGERRQAWPQADAYTSPAARAIKRRDVGKETLGEIARSYNVSRLEPLEPHL